jgi:hypothetical protein
MWRNYFRKGYPKLEWIKYRSTWNASDPVSISDLLDDLKRTRNTLILLSNGATYRLTLPWCPKRVIKPKIDIMNNPLYNPKVKTKAVDESTLTRFLKKYKGWDSAEYAKYFPSETEADIVDEPKEEEKETPPPTSPVKPKKKGK